MIDLHSHILPAFDEGAENLDVSFKIIKAYLKNGISTAVCSSHIEDLTPENVEKLEKSFYAFRLKVKEFFPAFTVVFGAEVSINSGIIERENFLRKLTLNKNGKYILIELPYLDIPIFFKNEIYNLCLHRFVPIICHPERNIRIIKNPDVLEDYINIGALVQCNTGSILGQYGKKSQQAILHFLKYQYIHFLGSDVHNVRNRALFWQESLKKIKKYTDVRYLREITSINAEKAIQGEDIII